MDTIASKTPDPLPFAAWQAMTPAAAARAVQTRLEALPEKLRRAAVAWMKSDEALAADLSAVGARKQAPTGEHPLRGLPYFLKDLFDLAGVPTRAGSTFLPQVRSLPMRDAAIVQRLRILGAACAGKTHLVEFASGLTGENPHYGDCPHPHFPERLSGGSSSGSAALVGAGVVPLAIGTDTGGSVRVPAAWCGLYGFRLTPGDELIRDAFPLAPTLDTAGWFTANASDLLASWRALVDGANPSRDGEAGSNEKDSPYRGCYLGARKLIPNIDPGVAEACDRAAAALCSPTDAATEAMLLQSWERGVDSYVTIGMSEAHAVHRDWLVPHERDYDPVIWRRFTDAGKFPPEVLSGARQHLRAVRSAWDEFFRDHDFLVLPAVPQPAPTKAEATPELRRAILTLTAPASLGGLPVLTIPVPLPSGLSVGLQIVLPRTDSPVVPGILSQSGL